MTRDLAVSENGEREVAGRLHYIELILCGAFNTRIELE